MLSQIQKISMSPKWFGTNKTIKFYLSNVTIDNLLWKNLAAVAILPDYDRFNLSFKIAVLLLSIHSFR